MKSNFIKACQAKGSNWVSVLSLSLTFNMNMLPKDAIEFTKLFKRDRFQGFVEKEIILNKNRVSINREFNSSYIIEFSGVCTEMY